MFTINKCQQNISIQDLGRPTAQHLGFSGTGAADEYSFLLANQLLKNPSNTPALEIILGQVSLRFTKASTFVITGADCLARLSNTRLENNKIYHASANSELTLQMPKTMVYSYIAIEGGFECQYWLNSASQAKNEVSLGLVSPRIKQGTHFTRANINIESVDSVYQHQVKSHFHQNDKLTLRFIPSNAWSTLTLQQQQQIMESSFTIAPASDRMGYRLSGNPISSKLPQQLSAPVNYGTIQLPDDGCPIILMKDRQTIGGYPVLGNVTRIDLFRLAQKRPGESITFLPITTQQAQAQLFAFYSQFQTRAFEHLDSSQPAFQNS